MIETIAPWIAGVVLLILGGGVGWWRVQAHGGEIVKRKRAEEDLKDEKQVNERLTGPLPDARNMRNRLKRMLQKD